MDKEIKDRIRNKLSLASDIKNSKIKASVDNVQKTDGKITASFCISGLPTKKPNDWDSSRINISKIFDSSDQFAEYMEDFFSKTDQQLIELSKSAG